MDWDALVRRPGVVGGRRMLFLDHFLANDLLGAEPPKQVMESVRRD
jgi:hypothetical protein